MIEPLWAQDDSCRVCGATMNPLCAGGDHVVLPLELVVEQDQAERMRYCRAAQPY